MKEEQILRTIEQLSHSQGSYGRMLARLRDLEENDTSAYETIIFELEQQNFKAPVDLVMYLEG